MRSVRITIMRAPTIILTSLVLALTGARAAEPPTLAVFDLEMIDTSLPGQMNGPRA
jgi:hypothetical protein